MADSRTLVDSPIGVSSDCLFNLKSTCAPSRSLRTNLPSINGSTFLGGWNIRGPIQGSPLGDPGMGSRGGQRSILN